MYNTRFTKLSGDSKIKYKAILFDLDGTLLDTLADLGNSMNAALEHYGFATHPLDKYRKFVGDSVKCLVERTLPKDQLNEENYNKCLTAMLKEYDKRWKDTTKPYPGIIEMLDELEKREIPKVVLSNKPHDSTIKCVETFFPNHKFQAIQGVSEQVKRKPDPAGAIKIAQELNIAPADFLYLGDTNTDMQTALAAGMFPTGVLWGFREADELTANGAKALIDHPKHIIDILDGRI